MSESPILVSESEHALLGEAAAVLSRGGTQHDALLRRSRRVVPTIAPPAASLLDETLRKGVVLALLRRGGWRMDTCAHGGRIFRGRAFERHPELQLRFTASSHHLLVWLRDVSITRPERPFLAHAGSLGDELMFYLALDHFGANDEGVAQAPFLASPLCWLGHTAALARHGSPPAELSFAPFCTDSDGHSIVLECLQADLTRRWIMSERAKAAIVDLGQMRALGDAQTFVLERLFDALDFAGRRDLATFLVDAALPLVRPDRARGSMASGAPAPTHHAFVGSLDNNATLEARQSAFVAAAAFLRAVGRLGRWHLEHGSTRHFDEGYDVAQMLLSRWERLGSIGFERAERLARDLESHHGLGAAEKRR